MLVAPIIVFVESMLQKSQILYHWEHTNKNISILCKINSEIPVTLKTS